MSEVYEKLSEIYTGGQLTLVQKAYEYAEEMHENQKRASGEPYFIHPCAVAEILIDLGLDAPTVAAAFLHDVIEDTSASEADISQQFGGEVLELVQGVTKLEKIEFTSLEEEQAENFRKIFVAMAKDIRVIMIKLADRLHNMRSLNFLSPERQKRMARETLDVYAPIAGRLGISQIKCELDDLSLKYLDPEAYEYLSTNINEKLIERRAFVDEVVKDLKELLDESNIKGEVFGRPKHFYSIYKKMKNQNKTLDQLYDLTAVRVIVSTVDECYEVFGKIHHKWKPIPGRIKDYIATPKPNGYQSLHTTVVTNFGKIFEIQIRTENMNVAAEFGIAAHWKYKENRSSENDFDKRLSWIREVMEWQGSFKDSKEFLDTLKGDLYSNEVLVFTPKGDVISLPKDATPLDFAYAIHSAVGNKCVGAKVNGKIVTLNSTLTVGDVVEVITSTSAKGPSWDWLKIVKSSGAKAKIKQFFKHEMKDENIKVGKSMLENEAKKKGYNLVDLLSDTSFERLSVRMSFSNIDEMYASVGYGAVTTNQVLVKLIDYYKKSIPKVAEHKLSSSYGTGNGIIVKGLSGDVLVRFAGCCNPVPGDKIVGFISRGRGITVHRADCPNMKEVDKERLIEVEWASQAGKSSYNAGIKVIAESQATILALVTMKVSQMQMDITSINGRIDTRTKQAIVDINIRLTSRTDLDDLIESLRKEPKIIDVYRTTI